MTNWYSFGKREPKPMYPMYFIDPSKIHIDDLFDLLCHDKPGRIIRTEGSECVIMRNPKGASSPIASPKDTICADIPGAPIARTIGVMDKTGVFFKAHNQEPYGDYTAIQADVRDR